MPRTGRPRLPAAVKKARGETRPSRLAEAAPPEISAPASLDPPSGLSGSGLAEWRRVAQALSDADALKETDLAALEDYCRALTELRRFEAKAKKAGPELAIAKGYLSAVIKLRTHVAQLRAPLGLTPSSRSAVKAAPKKGKSEDEEFFGGGPRGIVGGGRA